MKYFRLILLILTGAVLVGCGGANVEINPEGGVEVTITLTEEELNFAIGEALSDGDNTLLLNPQLTLGDGMITVTGEYFFVTGEKHIGTMMIHLGAENGALTAEITSVEIEGFDADEGRLANLNQRLASALTRYANRDGGPVSVQAVNVSDAGVQVTLTVQRSTQAP